MTIIGWFVIPIGILVFSLRPLYLLPLMVIASVFELSTVFNGAIGQFTFGVSAFAFLQILIILRFFMDIAGQWNLLPPKTSPARNISVPLIVFLVWAFSSAFVMPRLFAGLSIVSPREANDSYFVLAPLQWSWSNFAQAGYMALNILTMFYAFRVVKTEKQSRKLCTAFQIAALVVTVAAFVQYISPSLYPYELLNSSPAEYKGSDQELYGFLRVTGTFGEPSSAGSFLSAAAIGMLASYLAGRRGLLAIVGLVSILLALLFTTSTTGYLAFVVLGCYLLFYFRQPKNSKRGWVTILAIVFAVPLLILTALRLKPELLDAFLSVTTEKTGTNSFIARLLSDAYALDIFKDTWGIGAGLGSSRSSSLVSTFLSCLGIVGVCLLVTVFYRMRKLFPGKSAPPFLQLTAWAFVGLILAGAIGFPDVNRPPLWALFTVVACQLNVRAESFARVMKRSPIELSVGLGENPGVAPAN